ncbi:conserved hypothetical protein [Helicobacter hepaticus ATCC 51449]|uniref:Uncharacterized protein n=1 Tax=Helicobacter hepaticus (strain ATCC 51449 / 3B1) TaxID=235279 RepID=Q7VHH9_HELHP|nr:conserved hypothetical protein [Helicobacter hepaticus ATCC 51449]
MAHFIGIQSLYKFKARIKDKKVYCSEMFIIFKES